ncbi:MAG: tetratricopeptide repeat protein [Planctomycetia bacterium]|nr:tetratricopeptide repeat protein [Planctomycetia bacterium]
MSRRAHWAKVDFGNRHTFPNARDFGDRWRSGGSAGASPSRLHPCLIRVSSVAPHQRPHRNRSDRPKANEKCHHSLCDWHSIRRLEGVHSRRHASRSARVCMEAPVMTNAQASQRAVAILGFLTVLLWSENASAQAVGSTVVVTDTVDVMENGEAVGNVFPGDCLRIEQVDGDLYRVRATNRLGWIRRSDVIPLERAIDFFTDRLRKKPNVRDFVCRAEIWRKLGDYENAMRDFDESVRVDPESAFGYGSRALEWRHRGEIDKAIADETKVIQLESKRKVSRNYSHAYFSRAHSLQYKGAYDEAISDLTEAIRIEESENLIYYAERAMALLAKGDHDKALDDGNELIRIEPKAAGGHFRRGRVWSARREYDKALADFNTAVQFGPDSPGAFQYRAWFLATCPEMKYRDGVKAVADAKKMQELWGDWRQLVHYHQDVLAAAYAEAGDFENAIKYQEEALAHVSKPYQTERISVNDKDEYAARLALYRAGRPYRDEPKRNVRPE